MPDVSSCMTMMKSLENKVEVVISHIRNGKVMVNGHPSHQFASEVICPYLLQLIPFSRIFFDCLTNKRYQLTVMFRYQNTRWISLPWQNYFSFFSWKNAPFCSSALFFPVASNPRSIRIKIWHVLTGCNEASALTWNLSWRAEAGKTRASLVSLSRQRCGSAST